MNTSELEELISAYLDNELPPGKRDGVEALIRSNAAAKRIWTDYTVIRAAFQRCAKRSEPRLPDGFSKSVLSVIQTAQNADADSLPKENASISERELQSRSVDTRISYQTASWKSRLTNVRVWAFPLVVLIVAVLINLFHPSSDSVAPSSNPTQIAALDPKPNNTVEPNHTTGSVLDANGERVYAPMPELSFQKGNPPQTQQPTVFTVKCTAASKMSTATYFPKLFASQKISWTRTTDGNATTTVYEVKIAPKTLKRILKDFADHPTDVSSFTLDKPLETRLDELNRTHSNTSDEPITVRILVDEAKN